MKKIFVFTFFIFTIAAQAQQAILLKINHKLGNQPFAFNQAAINNLSHDFKLTRMQYYLSKFAIIHDGNQVSYTDTVFALVDAGAGVTSIHLGNYPGINSIEGIRFGIGVKSPENNQDPSLWPASHPLSPKIPSMHWGWASGYFFAALSGNSTPSFNQTLEIHALGNTNYFTKTILTNYTIVNGQKVITLNADYAESLKNISISSGLVVHGTSGDAATLLANFRDYVFSPVQTIGLNENSVNANNITMYPVPSNGNVTFDVTNSNLPSNALITITDITGRVINQLPVTLPVCSVNIAEKGIYFATISTGEKTIATRKLMIY